MHSRRSLNIIHTIHAEHLRYYFDPSVINIASGLSGLFEGDCMSRPKPSILLSYTDPKTFKSEQVLKAEAIYAVFYEGVPINLRNLNSLIDYPGPKYKKTSFSNPGHAYNLAEKLNKLFKTTKFAVYQLTEGERIDEVK